MASIVLQRIAEAVAWDSLPPEWNSFDLAGFSREKKLWDYQQDALCLAARALWKYYEDLGDYQPGEGPEASGTRKAALAALYEANGLALSDLDLAIGKNGRANRRLLRLLQPYYDTTGDSVSYQQLLNRMGFWMATGSGKTLVIVKLMQLLHLLMARGEIPSQDILLLTHRDDLLSQLENHIREYNQAGAEPHLVLHDLKDYPRIKREYPSLFQGQERHVYCYRSDNLSDEQKEKIVDFHNYDADGRWYVLLDEAHKGDQEDSKRQHIFSILSRNGFLFNFSATFTDLREVATTVCNFNLSEFIRKGYGKHVAVLQQEARYFKPEEDYSESEKQKVVLMALLMLAYARRHATDLQAQHAEMYHRPLLVVLVNSVNTQDADLKLFFRELVRIAGGQVADSAVALAAADLANDLAQRPQTLFEQNHELMADLPMLKGLRLADLLRDAFNADAPGEVEVLLRPSDRKELAFKLKTSDLPFAVIKIGDISNWLKNELGGYEVSERLGDEGYFAGLNDADSPVNMLLGSRGFYEGWDSTRPNVITYINIGTGTEAQKFILQSAGRGVRVQPLPGKRRRLLFLHNAGEIDSTRYAAAEGQAEALETLLIFSTNREALRQVLQGLQAAGRAGGAQELPLVLNSEAVQGHPVLIPTYRISKEPAYQRGDAKFALAGADLALLQKFVTGADDRVLLALYQPDVRVLPIIRKSLQEPDAYYRQDGRAFRNRDVLLANALAHFSLQGKEVDLLKEVVEEINHYRHVQVFLEDLTALKGKVWDVLDYPKAQLQLLEKYEARQLSFEQFLEAAHTLSDKATYSVGAHSISLEYAKTHYYLPLIVAENEGADFIQHIVRTPSERKFLRQLEGYLKHHTGTLGDADWWMFSKLDETLDTVTVPYYDAQVNRLRDFKPDFIFWLQKGSDYRIAFVDPKGTAFAGYERKVDGYKHLFEVEGKRKVLSYNGLSVQVSLHLFTADKSITGQQYRPYWFDSIPDLAAAMLH